MSNLQIIKASAGSGKTFRLTAEFLKLLFTETENFRHILAVTFTNKATAEMKYRIVNELFVLSSGSNSDYLAEIIESSEISEKAVRGKATLILKNILHNYSYFSVGTIDSFFQKIIRAFTRDIGIQSGFSVELDTESVLAQAIDNLFIQLNEDKDLQQWLVRFAESRMEEGKSWNGKNDLIALGYELFRESYKAQAGSYIIQAGNRQKLNKYSATLVKIKSVFENTLVGYGKQGLEYIKQSGLEINDFSRKYSGAAGFFKNLESKNFNTPNSYVRTALESEEGWFTKDSEKKEIIRKVCKEYLMEHLIKTVQFYDENCKQWKTSQVILQNIYTLGILADISLQIERYLSQHNLFLLADAAYFIMKIIDRSDTPFIYEKTGNYFHYYMIDEFQDTSEFQWNNFKPLLSNSLSQGYNCLLVGDVKQSIYRWRNSNWEVLSSQVFKDFYKEVISVINLNRNWRSLRNIINFNNSFFRSVVTILDNQCKSEIALTKKEGIEISDIFNDFEQEATVKTADKGIVEIQLIEKDGNEEATTLNNLLKLLITLLDKGYSASDIAILIRSKADGKKIVDFFAMCNQQEERAGEYQFNFISDELLFLSSSVAVNFIVALLRFFEYPVDKLNKYYILSEYVNYIKKAGGEAEDIKMDILSIDEDFVRLLPSEFISKINFLKELSLFELIENLILLFELGKLKGETAYLSGLQDMVLEYSDKKFSGIWSFIDYWDERGRNKSLSSPEKQDAFKIMTIHKAKGLEFKIVILPFCNWKFEETRKNNFLWCKPSAEPFNQLDIVPVKYTANLADTIFNEEYYTEKAKQVIDNLNLLYVAFTRAKEGLFCFTLNDDKEIKKTKDISGLLRLYLKDAENQKLFRESNNVYTFGEWPLTEKTVNNIGTATVNDYPVYLFYNRVKVAFRAGEYLYDNERTDQGPLNYGKIMHELLSSIYTIEDVPSAVRKMQISGKINSTESNIIENKLRELISDPVVNKWFLDDWRVLNERDIVVSNNVIKRPDRILLKDQHAVVIDFKFGDIESDDHKKQVMQYAKIIEDTGFKNTEGYIIYVKNMKLVNVTNN